MKKYSKQIKRALTFALAVVMVATMSMVPSTSVSAATKKAATKLTGVSSKKTVTVGKSFTIKAKVSANQKVSKKDLLVTVKSSNKKVATVKIVKKPTKKAKTGVTQIKVTGKKAGKATVTVTAKLKNKKGKKIVKKMKVTVKDAATAPSQAPSQAPSTKPSPSVAPSKAPSADPSKAPAKDEEPKEPARVIEDSMTDSYGLDFTNSVGWFNNQSWGQTGLESKKYEAGEAPSKDCGEGYLSVTVPYIHMMDKNLAEKLELGVTYSFSYYAKLGEGVTDGSVNFNVASVTGSYAETAATVKYDDDYKFTDKWQLVTGTFTMPEEVSEHAQVKIYFDGADAFCIDEVKIGNPEHNVKTDVLANFNTNFEGPYWWNTGDWNSLDDTNYTAYAEGEAPTEECGTKYVKANGQIQICHADIAAAIAPQTKHAFSFYAKLGEGATEGNIELGVNTINGNWSVNLPAEIKFDGGNALTNGWKKYTGTFEVPANADHTQVLVAVVAKNGDNEIPFCVDNIRISAGESTAPVIKEIEKDIPNLYEVVSANTTGIGADTKTGTCIPGSALTDEARMELVAKHFNSVTCENEMKPEAILGGEPDLDDSELGIKLNFSQGDAIADALLAYNEEHGTNIKMRGHVLVWHSQTPAWFYHEDYDLEKPLMSKAAMIERMDLYIKAVMEHFYAADSKYKDLVYAWDVVNEAISDGTNSVRTAGDAAGQETSWYSIFSGDDSFICQAFVSANKYAPANVKLFYNDYNDTTPAKVAGIKTLLTHIKATEGARISGMGMQAHYGMDSPSLGEIENAVRTYCSVVGEVQFTEIDFKSSNNYDGSAASKKAEYTKEGYRYKAFYEKLRELNAEAGINISAIVFWGTDDSHSWLNDANGAGGGSDGSRKMCPLLFDANYQAKPAYWGIVDPTQLEPYVNEVVALKEQYSTIEMEDYPATINVGWDAEGLHFAVDVKDSTVDAEDGVEIYVDYTNDRENDSNTSISANSIMRTDASESVGGYLAMASVSNNQLEVGTEVAFDVVITDGAKKFAYNDKKFGQATSSRYYAKAVMKPYAYIAKGSADITDVDDAAWDDATTLDLTIRSQSPEASAKAQVLYNEDALYIKTTVVDPTIDTSAANEYERDSVEIFIDEDNGKTDSLDANDKQYRIDTDNHASFNGDSCKADYLTSKVVMTDDGYIILTKILWSSTPSENIGFDIQINDGKGGKRVGTLNWYDESGSGWSKSAVFGTVHLGSRVS